MVPMARSGQEKQPRTGHRIGIPPATITFAALLITTLVVVGCGRTATLIGRSRPHATVTPTIAILPGPSLAWKAGSLPPFNPTFAMEDPFDRLPQDTLGGLYFDPGNGNTAYSCIQSASASVGPSAWVTHDRAQHWTQLAPLPSVSRHLYICLLIPDAANPSIMAAVVSWGRSKDLQGEPYPMFISQFAQFVTIDGGTHWQSLRGPRPFLLDWLATYHGTTLAMLESGDGSAHLWSSTDQMRTWHELPQAPYGEPLINPATGDMLVLNGGGSTNTAQISQSRDLGQHWTPVPVPTDFSTMPSLVSPPVADQPWRICGYVTPPSDSSFSTGTFQCSVDSGRTWTSRPQLITTSDNTDKGIVTPYGAAVVAVCTDGTLYTEMDPSYWPIGIPAGFYQLAPQATRWQSADSPPDDAVDTAILPGGGILWTMSAGDSGPGFVGPFPAATM